MREQTAEALAMEIQQIVSTTKLSWKNCVGKCFDGASVMSVQAKIKAIAHQPNLVLMNAIKDISEFVDVFGKVRGD
jgi:hypothetical protein